MANRDVNVRYEAYKALVAQRSLLQIGIACFELQDGSGDDVRSAASAAGTGTGTASTKAADAAGTYHHSQTTMSTESKDTSLFDHQAHATK